jgi:hypothetical protein
MGVFWFNFSSVVIIRVTYDVAFLRDLNCCDAYGEKQRYCLFFVVSLVGAKRMLLELLWENQKYDI